MILGADLGATDGLVQTGRSADEELDVALLGLGENRLQQVLVDVALATGPALGRVVQNVEGLEALGVSVLQIRELLLQENVVLTDVAKHQSNLGLVVGVLENLTSQLVHGSDTRTTGDQGDVVVLVSLPGVLGKRALEFHALADIHAVEVLRHGAVGVSLDDKLELAGFLYRSISSNSMQRLNGLTYLHR